MAELEEKLLQKYENLLRQAQQYKTPEKEMTIFDTALKNHHENPTTELLSFFLNPEQKHGLEASFYDGFVEAIKQLDEYQNHEFGQFIKIETQQTTSTGKYIDLWFETDTSLIIVEVKVQHIQNNPFTDYMKWGQQKLTQINKELSETEGKKKLITLILSPTGISDISNWKGISFTEFTDKVQKTLGFQIIKNPMSKWGIFARDFLIHLNSFNEFLETDMESIKFVVENMKHIQELVDLREKTYQEIINHINSEISKSLGNTYQVGMRRHTWSGTPAFRFIGNNWKDWSDTVLNLHIGKSPMSCGVNMYIQYPTDEIVSNVIKLLEHSPNSMSNQRYESGNKYWVVSFNFNTFDLSEITQLIVFTQGILNRVETEWKS